MTLIQAVAGLYGAAANRAFGLKPERLVTTPDSAYTGVAPHDPPEPPDAMGRAARWPRTANEALSLDGQSRTSLKLAGAHG